MFRRISGLTLLLATSPVAAQFGVGGGRKNQGGSFQELNEQAKQMADGGGAAAGLDMGDLAKMMGEVDPKMLEDIAALGPQFEEVMKIMAEMTPEDLEKQMQEAMEMMQGGDILQNMLQNQDEIFKTLEETGQVDAEELAKFKADPEYFEMKMKDSFDQMSQMFSDPDVLKVASESMQGMQDLYNNPGAMDSMMQELLSDFDDDEKIEEVRQMFLTNPEVGVPGMKEMFEGDEMQAILQDPKKWRETVKEGQGFLNQGVGAGVGEL